MKTNTRTLPTRFAPATRFRVKPTVPRLDKTAHSAEFETLKNRLLDQHLGAVADAEAIPFLRRAAMEAAALAWATPYPLLVLPELLSEKAADARHHAARQAVILRRSQALLAEAA